MRFDARQQFGVGMTTLALLAIVPGVTAAKAVEPSVVLNTNWLRAAAAFLLVCSFGAVALTRYGGVVERARDASADSPLRSMLYGLFAHVIIVFASGVFAMQVASRGVDGRLLSVGAVLVVGTVLLALAGLGFAAVGTALVELRGEGQRWHGFVVTAAVGAAGWLLPLIAGLALWVLLVSAGIGGATREWVHAERTVEARVDGQ